MPRKIVHDDKGNPSLQNDPESSTLQDVPEQSAGQGENKEVQTVTTEDVGAVKVEGQSKTPRVLQLKKELEKEKEALEKELAPYRELYEKHVNDPKYLEARVKIKEISSKLGPICNELASIARAGGSKGIKIEPGEFKHTEG
jgi:hypothetical protein